MTRKNPIYEGKAKILYEGPEPDTLIQHFKDDATAFNNQKHAVISGKGILNNRISEYLMSKLGEIGIPTHFIRSVSMREQLIHKLEIIPLEVIVRNVAAGSLTKRLGIAEGTPLPRNIIEFSFKDDSLNDPLVTEDYILAFGWAEPVELEEIKAQAQRINDFLCGIFIGVGIKLIDMKLEFGRLYSEDGGFLRIILADEISPDTCRLWDAKTNKKFDKDRFRQDLGEVAESYQEVARRLGVLIENVKEDDAEKIKPIRPNKK